MHFLHRKNDCTSKHQQIGNENLLVQAYDLSPVMLKYCMQQMQLNDPTLSGHMLYTAIQNNDLDTTKWLTQFNPDNAKLHLIKTIQNDELLKYCIQDPKIDLPEIAQSYILMNELACKDPDMDKVDLLQDHKADLNDLNVSSICHTIEKDPYTILPNMVENGLKLTPQVEAQLFNDVLNPITTTAKNLCDTTLLDYLVKDQHMDVCVNNNQPLKTVLENYLDICEFPSSEDHYKKENYINEAVYLVAHGADLSESVQDLDSNDQIENINTYLANMFTWIKDDALDSPLANDNTKQYLSKYFSLAERNDSLDTLINNAKNEISGETDITDNSKNIDENVR